MVFVHPYSRAIYFGRMVISFQKHNSCTWETVAQKRLGNNPHAVGYVPI